MESSERATVVANFPVPVRCEDSTHPTSLDTSIEADAEVLPGTPRVAFKRMYLAYRTAPPEKAAAKSDVPLVFMSETVEPHCYWTLEQAEPFTKTEMLFRAKATCGDFKDFYLNLGSEVDDKV